MESLNSRSVLSPDPPPPYGSNWGHKIVALEFCLISPLLLLLYLQNVLRGIGKAYVESLNSRSVLPPAPPYGSNWGHKIADFDFLPYISFIVAFIPSECIKRYWESICGESK